MFYLNFILSSLRSRLLTAALSVATIALSIALLISIDAIRKGARQGFQNTISQTDLIVGAKGGTLQLVLYAVFRMGSATDNLSYESYKRYQNHPAVRWTIPYSLGDSHKGFRVVGTTGDFYEHFRYHGQKQLQFEQGNVPQETFEVVLGSQVAQTLKYKLKDAIVLTHGISHSIRGVMNHDDKPFRISGILEPTGTPVDRSLYITLEGMEALHDSTQIRSITSFLLGVRSRIDTLRLQRDIQSDPNEALMAVIPGVALSELWETLGFAENILLLVSSFVLISGLLSIIMTIYSTLELRRREMSILRSLGGRAAHLLLLLVGEAFFLSILGVASGLALSALLILFFRPILNAQLGIDIPLPQIDYFNSGIIFGTIFLGTCAGIIPFFRAYKNLLQDGLSMRFLLLWGLCACPFSSLALAQAPTEKVTFVTLPFLREVVREVTCGQINPPSLVRVSDDLHHIQLTPQHKRFFEQSHWLGLVNFKVETWLGKLGDITQERALNPQNTDAGNKERSQTSPNKTITEGLANTQLLPYLSADESKSLQLKDDHIWHSAEAMVAVSKSFSTSLISTFPQQSEKWSSCTQSYIETLKTAKNQVNKVLSSIPLPRRVLVTEHNAFSYFAREHGFKVLSLRAPGSSHHSPMLPKDFKNLSTWVKRHNGTVFFLDEHNSKNQALKKQIVSVLGLKVGSTPLMADGPKEDASPQSLTSLWLYNARILGESL